MEADNEVRDFLIANGLHNLIEKFSDVRTMLALSALDENDLVELLEISKVAAKIITKKLQGYSSSTSTTTTGVGGRAGATPPPDASSSTVGGQIVPVPMQLEIAGMKNTWNLERQSMTNEMEKNKITAEFENQLNDSKNSAQFALLQQMIQNNEKTNELERKIIEEKMKGRLDVAEAEKKALIDRISEQKRSSIHETDLFRIAAYNYFPGLYPGDSNLLNVHYFQVIQGWLPSPRNWVLLYRGTRDGFNSTKFHTLCNNNGATVSIVRSTSGYIFGGYNPNGWTSSQGYQSGANSFIFTLLNQWGYAPTKFTWVKSQGPYDHTSHGPTFGGGHDLYICNGCNTVNSCYSNFPTSYNDTYGHANTTFAGSYNFTVSEIEVFRVF